jgi:hypothetical protein
MMSGKAVSNHEISARRRVFGSLIQTMTGPASLSVFR